MHTVRTRGDSGLGLRSPHPIRGALLHRYRAERGFDAWKAKGILTARVDVPGRPLNVGVTHLQSGKGPKNAAVRGAQVAELLEQTERAGVWVLLGDFNFYDDEPIDTVSHTRLVEAGFVDVGQAAGAKRGTYPGMPDRFDRIYVRSACSLDATAEVIDGAGLSDHHFVAAELTL